MFIPQLRLKSDGTHRCLLGHPWIFDSELEAQRGSPPPPGAIVDVVDGKRRFIGRGYFNPNSRIRVRLLSRQPEAIDEAFFRRRLEAAIALRRRLFGDEKALRLVFSESDFLPGLIVDRYEDHLSVQILTLGIDVHRDMIARLLRELLEPAAIYERSDAAVRKLEGLETVSGFLGPAGAPVVQFRENGILFEIDFTRAQKTGYFFDQRANRRMVQRFAADRNVLDCFGYVGSFALHAAAAGARSVVGVDYSADATAQAVRNAELNGAAERCEFVTANCFDQLRAWERDGRQFDVIVLDPPAFAKNRASVLGALRGYKEINLRAMKMLPPGGILITCSCSHHVSTQAFEAMTAEAASDAGRTVRLLYRGGQDADHPALPAAPETDYLKCLVLEMSP